MKALEQRDLPIYNEQFVYPLFNIKRLYEILTEKGMIKKEFRAKDLNDYEENSFFSGSIMSKLVRLGVIKKVDIRKEVIEIPDPYGFTKFKDEQGRIYDQYDVGRLKFGTKVTVLRETKEVLTRYAVYKLNYVSYDSFLSKMFTRFVDLTESL